MPTRPLSLALLDRFERQLTAAAAELLGDTADGRADDELDQLRAGIPARLPEELVLWWGERNWHTGRVPPRFLIAPLASCVSQYTFRLSWAREEQRERADEWWSPYWLPVFSADGGVVIAADLRIGSEQLAPLREIDWQSFGSDAFARIIAPSLGALLLTGLDDLEAGRLVYDRETESWHAVA